MNKHCHLATGRLGYIAQAGERVINTTVKSGTGLGRVFAPTWDMVMASKRGSISWAEYTERYTALMRERYVTQYLAFMEVLTTQQVIVLTCYCADSHTSTRHCHRYLLVDILAKIGAHHSIEVIQLGERR